MGMERDTGILWGMWGGLGGVLEDVWGSKGGL